MKLSDWPNGFDYPGIAEYLQARITDLKTTEDEALVIDDDNGNPRALIATDVALLDCRYIGATGPSFEVRAVPWEAVPPPWITFSWFGAPDKVTMMFRLDLDRVVTKSYDAPDLQAAAREFYFSVLRRRRPDTPLPDTR